MPAQAPSARVMTFVWLCAVVIAAGGMAGLLRMAPYVEWRRPPPFGVFIGTSLVQHAVPPVQPANDIFGTAEASDLFVRKSSPALSAVDTLDRVRHAVRIGVKRIFVEVDPLIRTRPIETSMLHDINNLSDRLRDAMREWLGRSRVWNDFPGDTIYDGNIRELALIPPATIHPPQDLAAIIDVLALASRQGLDIVWVAMPRPETTVTYLGPTFEIAFSGQLQAFASAFNAKVWRPAIFWPNELFIDRAHMNAAGRARFMSELRRYGVTR